MGKSYNSLIIYFPSVLGIFTIYLDTKYLNTAEQVLMENIYRSLL